MKIAELFESAADGWAVLDALLGGVVGEAFLGLDQVALALESGAEQGAVFGRQATTRGPQLVGSGTGWALRPSLAVGLGLGGAEVVQGPVAGAAVMAGVLVGSRFQRADACFDGPIIPWHACWREQRNDAGLVQKGER